MELELEPEILNAEVERAIKSLANNKAPGCDNLPAELIKPGGEELCKALTILCNQVWRTKGGRRSGRNQCLSQFLKR